MAQHAVVIGAGVIGCAVANELAKKSFVVTVVDALPAAGYGSTSASSAIVRFSYSTRAGVAMSYEGLHWWRNWADVLTPAHPEQLAEFIQYPMIMWKLPNAQYERVLPHFDALGIAYDDLTAAELTDRYPYLATDSFGPPVPLDDAGFFADPSRTLEGGFVMPESGYISDPMLAAQNLQEAAVANGASFRFTTRVVAITSSGGRVTGVELDGGGTIDADIVVNVAGPHASKINELAGVLDDMNVHTRALHREVYIVPQGDLDLEGNGVMIGDEDVGVYFRPERGGNLLVGSAEPECDELVWIDDPDAYEPSLDEDEFQRQVLRAARRLDGLPIPRAKRGVAALYDASDDWLPIYDRSSLDGFYLACGSSGNQFKNAPIAGFCMAALIEAVESGRDHDGDPLQVAAPFTGFSIDMGTFSRLRNPAATSMNVFG